MCEIGRTVSGLNENKIANEEHILSIVLLSTEKSEKDLYFELKAMLENTFLESTARLQPERNQTVIQTGPYSAVRHPTYSAVLMWCVAVVCIFPSAEVLVLSFATATVIIIRTKLEDEMLKKGLFGYEEYSKKVKYRLIPYIW